MDVLVISPTGVRRETIDGLGGFQGMADNEIFANAGGTLSRWQEGRFVTVETSQAAAIRARLKRDALPEGWSAVGLGPTLEPAEREFSVGGRRYRLRVWPDDDTERMTIVDDSGKGVADWSINRASRSVDEQTYIKLFGS